LESWFTNWPWWLGGAALGALAIGFCSTTGLPLGVSRSYGRLADAIADRTSAAREAALSDKEALEAALRAATAAEFGDAALTSPEDAATADARDQHPGFVPWSAHLAFVIMVVVGGALATVLRGGWTPKFDLGVEHRAMFGGGAAVAATLFVAGILVGFGTRMGAGCTSGHGLSGCSRGQPGSLVGTACFFAAGVAVSFALGALV
jgi:hypothetical protein